VLAALLRSGKLTAVEPLVCPGHLTIAGRNFDCSHPKLDSPMRVETALAYSCNYFVARMADRFAAGELPAALSQAGFGEASGRNSWQRLTGLWPCSRLARKCSLFWLEWKARSSTAPRSGHRWRA
jgi:cell division protein FtsI/penicillin-binding protein 2